MYIIWNILFLFSRCRGGKLGNIQNTSSQEEEENIMRTNEDLLDSESRSFGSSSSAKCKRRREDDDNKIGLAIVQKLNGIEEKLNTCDENDAFGEYVTQELNKMSPLEEAILKRNISNLIQDTNIKRLTCDNFLYTIINSE